MDSVRSAEPFRFMTPTVAFHFFRMPTTDTICAISSPPGQSARGLVRLSGPAIPSILALLGVARDTSRRIAPVRIALPTFELSALSWQAQGPNTYTGEDCAEIITVGNPNLLQRIVDACIAQGARLADPGEFTFRAYTNGRLDLTQAEGVAATISAVSDAQLAAAKHLQAGELGSFAQNLVDQTATLLALVEAGIDFVDQEDVVPIAPGDLLKGLNQVRAELDQLLTTSRSWSTLDGLPRVVLVGPPSAGKSTLFNALLGHERAVIDATPGTTRDAIEEPLVIQTATGPAEVMLVDIAGLGAVVDNPLDRLGQAQAQQAINTADLVLITGPEGCKQTEGLRFPATSLRVITKIDAPGSGPLGDARASGSEPVRVSALNNQGLDTLKAALVNRLADRAVSLRGEQLALQPRHEQDLRDALAGIDGAIQALGLSAGQSSIADVELVAGAMRGALDALAALGGQMTPDDVIGRVFATFCVGK